MSNRSFLADRRAELWRMLVWCRFMGVDLTPLIAGVFVLIASICLFVFDAEKRLLFRVDSELKIKLDKNKHKCMVYFFSGSNLLAEPFTVLRILRLFTGVIVFEFKWLAAWDEQTGTWNHNHFKMFGLCLIKKHICKVRRLLLDFCKFFNAAAESATPAEFSTSFRFLAIDLSTGVLFADCELGL